jgi:hypothetical protein
MGWDEWSGAPERVPGGSLKKILTLRFLQQAETHCCPNELPQAARGIDFAQSIDD